MRLNAGHFHTHYILHPMFCRVQLAISVLLLDHLQRLMPSKLWVYISTYRDLALVIMYWDRPSHATSDRKRSKQWCHIWAFAYYWVPRTEVNTDYDETHSASV